MACEGASMHGWMESWCWPCLQLARQCAKLSTWLALFHSLARPRDCPGKMKPSRQHPPSCMRGAVGGARGGGTCIAVGVEGSRQVPAWIYAVGDIPLEARTTESIPSVAVRLETEMAEDEAKMCGGFMDEVNYHRGMFIRFIK